MAKVVGLVALFTAGLLLAGALASTGVADVTSTVTLPVTSFTCFVVQAKRAGVVLATSDAVCGAPGYSNLVTG